MFVNILVKHEAQLKALSNRAGRYIISSVKPVPLLAVNLHHLFSNGAALSYAIYRPALFSNSLLLVSTVNCVIKYFAIRLYSPMLG